MLNWTNKPFSNLNDKSHEMLGKKEEESSKKEKRHIIDQIIQYLEEASPIIEALGKQELCLFFLTWVFIFA